MPIETKLGAKIGAQGPIGPARVKVQTKSEDSG